MAGKKPGALKLTIAGILAVDAYFLMGVPFFRFITYGGKKTKDENTANRKKWFELKHTSVNHPKHKFLKEYNETRAWCEAQPMKEWYVRAIDGTGLHASYLPANNPERFVILCHGYRGTRFGSVAHIASYLHDNGCNLLFIDQRCCGDSEGEYITFGAREQYDVLTWLKRLGKENKKHLPVYLYGQSMGGTTVLLTAGHKLPAEVKGIIADCSFHSMKQQMQEIASEWFHLPRIGLFLFRMDVLCRIFGGFSMKQSDTGSALGKNRIPVLFFHGEDDTYVMPSNSWKNYELCKAEKELVMVPDARHLCCSFEDPILYQRKISEFFGKYDRIKR